MHINRHIFVKPPMTKRNIALLLQQPTTLGSLSIRLSYRLMARLNRCFLLCQRSYRYMHCWLYFGLSRHMNVISLFNSGLLSPSLTVRLGSSPVLLIRNNILNSILSYTVRRILLVHSFIQQQRCFRPAVMYSGLLKRCGGVWFLLRPLSAVFEVFIYSTCYQHYANKVAFLLWFSLVI